MQVSSLGTLFGAAQIRSRPGTAPLPAISADRSSTQNHASELRRQLRETLRMRELLADVRSSFRTAAAGRAGPTGGITSLTSSAPLGLDLTETATTLQSSEEVNTVATSFTPFGPAFTGSSTSLPTIGGTYSGNQDDVYTFEVRKAGTVGGGKDLKIRVKNQSGSTVDVINIEKNTPPDTAFTLSSGLTLSLSAGAIEKNDTFQVAVFSSVASAVDPDKPFDGTRNDQPNFEPGTSVTGGSFQLNGVTIAVSAGDTINGVLDKINSSAAGVTAVFNAAGETIDITHDTPGSAGPILLQNDTSGFLAATKLQDAVAEPGRDSDLKATIDSAAALGPISPGQFAINGISISVDPGADSLNDLIDRINQAIPQITASYETASDVFRIDAPRNITLDLDDGSAGFFSALGIEAKTYEVKTSAGPLGQVTKKTITAALDRLAKGLNRLSTAVPTDSNTAQPASLQRLWRGIERAAQPHLKRHAAPVAGKLDLFGVSFRLASSGTFAAVDRAGVSEALRRQPQAVFDFYLHQSQAGEPAGLLASLDNSLRDQQQSLLVTMAEAGIQVIDRLV